MGALQNETILQMKMDPLARVSLWLEHSIFQGTFGMRTQHAESD